MKKLLVCMIFIVGCVGPNVTPVERQDRANLRAAINEVERYLIYNAPTFPDLADVPDTSALTSKLPGYDEARAWKDAVTFLGLAKSAATNACESGGVTPLEIERGEFLCAQRDWTELFKINSRAKMVAGKNIFDQYSYLIFGVSTLVLISGFALWGIRKIIAAKAPQWLGMFDQLVNSVQKVRMEFPLQASRDIERAIRTTPTLSASEIREIIARNHDDALARSQADRKLRMEILKSKEKQTLKSGKA